MTRPLSSDEHAALAERIRAAEARTSGEIYCVVAQRSDDYLHPAALMLAVGALLAGLVAAFVLDRLWLSVPHVVLVAAQLAALAAGLAAIKLRPGLRLWLVPSRLRYRRAHDNAARQFLAHNVHLTAARTGILIFVSLAERYAEVVADAGIDAKVGREAWDGIIEGLVGKAADDRLAEGLAEAIARAGELLAKHFPGESDPNELEDHVVEI